MTTIMETGMFGLLVVLIYLGKIRAEKRKEQKIRSMAAINAIDDGVARAVEMGRPVLFHFGSYQLGSHSHWIVPGFALLHRVANKCGELGAHLIATAAGPVMVSVYTDIISEEYQLTGRDLNEIDVRYAADMGFPYVAAIMALLVKERPGAHFLFGSASFEAIIECELAASVGAFQVAGAIAVWQLPMYVATCDYTLIGEEYVVAGAVLSNNLGMLGMVAGADWGKYVILLILLCGSILAQFNIPLLSNLF